MDTAKTNASRPEIQEIATRRRDILYPAYNRLVSEEDGTLATRGGTKGVRVYDEIERDAYAYAMLHKRKMAVIGRAWHVEPATEARRDKLAADIVTAQLEAMQFDVICYNLLDAILKGYAVGEVMWGIDGSEVQAKKVIQRNAGRFMFDLEDRLRLRTMEHPVEGELMPDRKFIVHTVGSKQGSPYGLGLGTVLFWPVFFKRQGIQFWLTFADKFGAPTTIGKYPSGTLQPEQDKLLDALRALSRETQVAIPDGMTIELLEAQRSGTVDTYERLLRYMDEQIAHAVIGEAPGMKGGGGQLASAAILRNEVRMELVQADADMLSATLNHTLCQWITEYNVPGANPPTVWREADSTEDLKARSERDKNLWDMGFRPSLEYINETYGGEWIEAPAPKPALKVPGGMGEVMSSAPAAPGTVSPAETPQAEFAEGVPQGMQQLLDAVKNLPGAEIDAAIRKALEPVLAALKAAGSPEAALETLGTQYPDMDFAELEQLLARALYIAELWGLMTSESDA
jgi:phage gp29-like protein